jgi:hypothetical protein
LASELKRAWDRGYQAGRRAQIREAKHDDLLAWYRRQLELPDEQLELPPGITVAQHRAWCEMVLNLPSIDGGMGDKP